MSLVLIDLEHKTYMEELMKHSLSHIQKCFVTIDLYELMKQTSSGNTKFFSTVNEKIDFREYKPFHKVIYKYSHFFPVMVSMLDGRIPHLNLDILPPDVLRGYLKTAKGPDRAKLLDGLHNNIFEKGLLTWEEVEETVLGKSLISTETTTSTIEVHEKPELSVEAPLPQDETKDLPLEVQVSRSLDHIFKTVSDQIPRSVQEIIALLHELLLNHISLKLKDKTAKVTLTQMHKQVERINGVSDSLESSIGDMRKQIQDANAIVPVLQSIYKYVHSLEPTRHVIDKYMFFLEYFILEALYFIQQHHEDLSVIGENPQLVEKALTESPEKKKLLDAIVLRELPFYIALLSDGEFMNLLEKNIIASNGSLGIPSTNDQFILKNGIVVKRPMAK